MASVPPTPLATKVQAQPHAPFHVRLRGLSAAGVVAAQALVRAGAHLSLVDPSIPGTGTHEPGTTPAAAGGTRAERTARLLGDLRPDLRLGLDATRRVDAEVVTCVASLAPAVHHELVLRRIPHVVIIADDLGATVLPVLPEVTACQRCYDLARTRKDAAWPVIARQCESLIPALDPLTATVAGALAASIVIRLAAPEAQQGARPAPSLTPSPSPPPLPTRPWRVESGLPAPIRIPPDPECGCGAADGKRPGAREPQVSAAREAPIRQAG